MPVFRCGLASAAAVLLVTRAALAEPSPPVPSISGFVQVAYHGELAKADPTREQLAPLRGYTPTGNTFVLHSAHIAIAHAFNENVSARVEVDAGYDAPRTASYPFNDGMFDVQEAYATYQRGFFSLTAGKFAAYEGLEYIEGPLNPTVTRGYSFNIAEPNTHTGVKLHFTGDAVDLGIGLVNGWDVLIDNNSGKTAIWKLTLTPFQSLQLTFDGTFGPEQEHVSSEQRLSLDFNITWTANEHFSIAAQYNTGIDGIGGAADKVRWSVLGALLSYSGELFLLGARAELFHDPDGARTDLGAVDLLNLTLSPGLILAQGFKLRLELRADLASKKVFGNASDPEKRWVTGAVDAEYLF